MKATGIVRRIDDLGRVVIPKEIRRTLGIKEGDPMEIYMTGEGVMIQRYRPNDQWTEQLAQLGNEIIQDTSIKMEIRTLIVQRLNDLLDTFKDEKSPSSAATE